MIGQYNATLIVDRELKFIGSFYEKNYGNYVLI